MYCTQCGAMAVADAKFCARCGSPIGASNLAKPSEALSSTDGVAKPRILWLYIAGLLLVFGYALMLSSAFAGQRLAPELGASSTFWTAVFFYYVWKRRALKGWQGALIGSALGLLVFVATAFVYGYMRGAPGT